jgi:hypothetical protein
LSLLKKRSMTLRSLVEIDLIGTLDLAIYLWAG